MSTKIQLKRGLESDLPILSTGEPAFTTDTRKLFIGSPVGNIQILNNNGNSIAGIATPNTQGWISTANQDTFQITNGNISDIRSLIVFVDGIIQPDTILVNSTTFKLPEPLNIGIAVYAIWFEVSASVNAQVNIPINLISGLNDYSTYYTYTSSGDIATETVKDSKNTVISTTTYNYLNNKLNTVVFTMNGTTVTSTYNYDSNGNLTSVVNIKS
jgi:YD repeat-containing protein